MLHKFIIPVKLQWNQIYTSITTQTNLHKGILKILYLELLACRYLLYFNMPKFCDLTHSNNNCLIFYWSLLISSNTSSYVTLTVGVIS